MPLSKFTTRYAEITSLAAFALVIVVYALTGDLHKSLALWIALVPVIFAIIVPVATTIGISLLAGSGVLVKSAEALENLTQIQMICFDKTGTLTEGKPSIVKILTFGGFTQDALLQLAAGVERYSEHHLGEPIVRAASDKKLPWLPAENLQIVKGRGIRAISDRKNVSIGNREFMSEQNVPAEGIPGVEQETALGASPIFVSVDQKIAGIIFLAAAPRSAIQSTLEKLKRAGYPLVMLTGDNREVARKIGAELGVTDVKAGFLPQDKIAFIREAKKSGRTVMMVGDGINDAPALAEANVGMAMGLRGVGMTLESAQVVLVHDNLEVLPELFGTARQTFRTIKIDLVLATGIHLLAAGLVLANIIGILGSTIIHQISSSLVLLNTLRLFSIRSRKDLR